MAYAASGLVQWAHGNDKKLFRYDSSADTLATILAAGYFDNDSNLRMAVGDFVFAKGSDGEALVKVASISSGAITFEPVNASGWSETASSTTASLANSGITNITSTGVITHTLAAPSPGAMKMIIKTTTSTAVATVHASTAGGVVTFDGTNDDLTFTAQAQAVLLVGVSSTRWAIIVNTGTVGVS